MPTFCRPDGLCQAPGCNGNPLAPCNHVTGSWQADRWSPLLLLNSLDTAVAVNHSVQSLLLQQNVKSSAQIWCMTTAPVPMPPIRHTIMFYYSKNSAFRMNGTSICVKGLIYFLSFWFIVYSLYSIVTQNGVKGKRGSGAQSITALTARKFYPQKQASLYKIIKLNFHVWSTKK